ncbi:ATP-binding protein [Blautia sp. MSJ-19]|uniref:ATP-binding protein n=1 Tax=Blautia sp. MSJ-19 TaxID=2841517 RepID=UPI001C0EF982|nr:ATP-binding protein [Blautia sp. MSJ-19]MBU5481090.1 response regulator [Blautia sp. MSJ-19]
MDAIADLLTTLGNNFSLVVIGSVEVLAGVFLLGSSLKKKVPAKKRQAFYGSEAVFLKQLNVREEEACIVIRCSDLMPVYATENLETLLGVSFEHVQRDVTSLDRNCQGSERSNSIWKQYKAWSGSSPEHYEIEMNDGRWLRMSLSGADDGKYHLMSFLDSTDIHKKIAQYEEALRKAEEESESKTTFLNRMSHEIRTPMNGIMGMLTLAESSLEDEAPARNYLNKAEELSGHLLALINDILDMSRIEAGKVELEKKSFSLRRLGQKLYDMFARNLEAEGIHYAVNFEDMTVDYVIGDELRISQVIINFLSNAVKFTRKGEITVTFRQMMQQEGMADLMICVHDTGIGMEPEFINRIFRPFEQESSDTSRTYGGSGLGMAITDHLVKLMGGEIVVRSTPGKGSDFSVFLHLPTAEAPLEEERQQETQEEVQNGNEAAFHGRNILMAEDNEINAMIAVEILSKMGAKVDVAENGQEAVEMFASHAENYYDFILMDVQMPIMDGRRAARKIRSLERADAETILIFALSADAFVEDERKSLESGMNAHYAKPVDYQALQRNIGVFLREKEMGR